MTYYIQYRCPFTKQLETVDEFDTRREAIAALREYKLLGPGYYLSTRCCKAWKEKSCA